MYDTLHLQKELNVRHPSSCMRDDHVHMTRVTLDVMEESHVEGGNEKRVDLQMLKKSYEEDNIDQAPIHIEKKDEVFTIKKRETGNL